MWKGTLLLPPPTNNESTNVAVTKIDPSTHNSFSMDGKSEVILSSPLFRVYKNGHADRLIAKDFFPSTTTINPDEQQGSTVLSKDITIDSNTGLSARLFLPTTHLNVSTADKNKNKKLPVVIYFHGSGFILASPFCEAYHRCVTTLVEKSNVVAVSVRYRRAPENPIPAAYEDSWAAIQWVASHHDGYGPDPWLNLYADFNRLFLAGDSAGANIAHNMAMRVGSESSTLGCGILGVALIHPYFWGVNPIGSERDHPDKAFVDKLWPVVCPDGPGNDDPRVNPLTREAPGLERLGCRMVLICVAGKDVLKDRGCLYYEALSKSGWMGDVRIHEDEGERHTFHLEDPDSESAKNLAEMMARFFNSMGLSSSPL